MRLSREYLSMRFAQLATEYRSQGCENEARLAEQHARDVRRLAGPRVLYLSSDKFGWYFRRPAFGLAEGPFRDRTAGLDAAWGQLQSERWGAKILAVVEAP